MVAVEPDRVTPDSRRRRPPSPARSSRAAAGPRRAARRSAPAGASRPRPPARRAGDRAGARRASYRVLALLAHRFERQDGLHVAVHLPAPRSRDHGHHRVHRRPPVPRAYRHAQHWLRNWQSLHCHPGFGMEHAGLDRAAAPPPPAGTAARSPRDPACVQYRQSSGCFVFVSTSNRSRRSSCVGQAVHLPSRSCTRTTAARPRPGGSCTSAPTS